VAERPQDLVVYGGRGQAARSWEAFDAILATLRDLADNETLLVQSGKPVAVFKSHPDAPRVLIANSNLVPHWATQAHFDELERQGLIMYGQMTAGSWIYIGTQGIVQGTYETLGSLARRYGTRVSAIRAANGLRSTRLRAGRSYTIPIRRMPPDEGPVVVPPRRLPPELVATASATAPPGGAAADGAAAAVEQH